MRAEGLIPSVRGPKTRLTHALVGRQTVNDWSTIVEEHGPDVWRTAFRLLSNHEDASDCYQETFLAAVEFARRQKVACWPAVLKRIVTARALDQLRRRYRAAGRTQRLDDADDPAERSPSPDALAQLRESMQQLRQALTEIQATQAEVFWLSEVEMLSHADIAAQLGATTQQVALWLHRGKKSLRKLLTDRGAVSEIGR
jgi:RNA polymerase sigma-70 factor (ECF subfamily)